MESPKHVQLNYYYFVIFIVYALLTKQWHNLCYISDKLIGKDIHHIGIGIIGIGIG